jgi:hypothetical protein
MLAMLVLMLPVIPATRTFLRSAAALLGLGLVIGSCYAFETGSASVFCAVLGGILLLQYGASGITGKLLGLRPVQWLGTVSFSLYLVHWPIFAMWRYIMFDEVSHAQLAMHQRIEDLDARRVGEHLEEVGQIVEQFLVGHALVVGGDVLCVCHGRSRFSAGMCNGLR